VYKIKICKSVADFEKAKKLARDYIGWLNMNLSFQNIEEEFLEFETIYLKPKGCFLVAVTEKDEVLGGVGLRKLSADICEMKRLFVYPEFLKGGIGKRLCLELIIQARNLGYKKMRLDTLARLEAANKLYVKLGFYEIEKYRENLDPTAKFLELRL
jgi:GNAT superfamily N-acetyltransferase